MPIYEYECESCGARFEVAQKFSDPLVTECRICRAPKIRKLLSPPAFVLKGTGWYATDYAPADRKKPAGMDAPKEAAAAGAGCAAGGCASGACPKKAEP